MRSTPGDPARVVVKLPSVTLQPPSITLQPPLVTLQLPLVTSNRGRLPSLPTVELGLIDAISFCFSFCCAGSPGAMGRAAHPLHMCVPRAARCF